MADDVDISTVAYAEEAHEKLGVMTTQLLDIRASLYMMAQDHAVAGDSEDHVERLDKMANMLGYAIADLSSMSMEWHRCAAVRKKAAQ